MKCREGQKNTPAPDYTFIYPESLNTNFIQTEFSFRAIADGTLGETPDR